MITIANDILENLIDDCQNRLEKSSTLKFKSAEEVTSKLVVNTNSGIVYGIYVRKELVYVGKSRGKYFKTRLRSHLFGKSKGTVSKHYKLKNLKPSNITIKYIELFPDALRNTVEELLIERYKELKLAEWNYQKKSIN